MRKLVLLALFIAVSSWTGCTTTAMVNSAKTPEIVIDDVGIISLNDKQLKPGKIAAALKAAGYKKTQEINILIPNQADHTLMRSVSAELVHGGYTRTVFVKKRKATASVATPQ